MTLAYNRPFNNQALIHTAANNLFNELSAVLNSGGLSSSFPPHNVYKDGDEYVIELAVAGYKKDDILLELTNRNLTVKSLKTQDIDNREYYWKGLASRAFTKTFVLDETVTVKEAEIEDGLLRIRLNTVKPEVIQVKEIKISKK